MFPGQVVESELHLSAYTTAPGQRRILDPLSKVGIKPACSWILVRCVSAVPQPELPCRLVFSPADSSGIWRFLLEPGEEHQVVNPSVSWKSYYLGVDLLFEVFQVLLI